MTIEQRKTFRDWMKIASPIISAIAICVTVSLKVGEGIIIITKQNVDIGTLKQQVSDGQRILGVIVPKISENESEIKDLDKRVSRIENNIDKIKK